MPISPEAAAAYNAGLNYLRQGRYSYDEAIAQFQQAAGMDPHSPLPFAGLAEAYVAKYNVERKQKALDDARVSLQAGEMLDPDSPRVRLAAAWLNIFQNKNAQAGEDCSRALEVDPGNAQAWMLCGYIYAVQGSNDKALKYYNKAIALDPSYFRPHQFLGGYYYYPRPTTLKPSSNTGKRYSRALNDMDGFSDLGGVLTEQGKYAEAEQIYRKALSIKATPASLNNLGVTLVYMGRDAQALPYYQQAAALEEF